MKKLEIIIKPEKLEDLKEVFDACDVHGMNVVNSMDMAIRKVSSRITVVRNMQLTCFRKLR